MADLGGSIDHWYGSGAAQKPLRPTSNYVWTGSLWVPQLATAAGSGVVGSRASVSQAADATLTRPNNGTAYAAHQGIGSGASCIFKFTNFFPANADTGLFTALRLTASVASIATTNMGAVRAHLYNASPSSPPASDQATFNQLVANDTKKLGFVDFVTWSIGGASSDAIESVGTPAIAPLPIVGAAGARDLYMILEATGAFTPIANAIINAYASGVFD